ncbi:MAG TPA: sialidase family protein [Jatrophihabitans sp.]|nr:sialidase family protein [Jatrophihabitans sp.]
MSTDIDARLEAAFRAAAGIIGEPEATEPRRDHRPVAARRDTRRLTGWYVPLAAAACALFVLAGSIALINHVRSDRPAHQPTASRLPPPSSAAPTASSTPAPTGLSGPSVQSAQLLPSGVGYARTDTAVLITADYGTSWTRVTPNGLTANQLGSAAVTFRPDGTLLIATASANGQLVTVYRRAHDSGIWSQSTVPVSGLPALVGAGYLPSLSFSDNDHGWLMVGMFITHIATGALLQTKDGGASWVQTASAIQEAGPVTAMSSLDGFLTWPMNGWTFVSHDGGSSWARFTLTPPPGKQSDSVMPIGQPVVSGSAVVIAAQFATADGPDGIGLYRSTDHGATWTLTSRVPTQADESDVFTVQLDGSYALLRSLLPVLGGPRTWTVSITSDAGRTFRDGASTIQVGDPVALWSAGGGKLWALTADNGCQNGKSDCHATTGILATSDGGASWQQLHLPD